jgi:hypothetical protein
VSSRPLAHDRAMAAPAHPGKITYVDGNTQQVLSTDDVSTVPESLRFADTPTGRVPVVKVVATVAGNQRTIREYGPAGELLRSTVQRK